MPSLSSELTLGGAGYCSCTARRVPSSCNAVRLGICAPSSSGKAFEGGDRLSMYLKRSDPGTAVVAHGNRNTIVNPVLDFQNDSFLADVVKKVMKATFVKF
jgi:hypothetical protein